MSEVILGQSPWGDHVAAYEADRTGYRVAALGLLGVGVLRGEDKLKVMLIPFHFKDFEFGEAVLYGCGVGFDEVFSVMRGLDAKRRLRAWSRTQGIILEKECIENKKAPSTACDIKDLVKKYETTSKYVTEWVPKGRRPAPSRNSDGSSKKKKRKIDTTDTCDKPRWLVRRIEKLSKLSKDIAKTESEAIANLNGSLSGNVCKRLRAWAASIPEERLTMHLLDFGLCLWKEFADAIHLDPATMSIPDFTMCAFDLKKKRTSKVEYAMQLSADDLDDLETLNKQQPSLKYLSKRFNLARLPDRVKTTIATYSPLTPVLKKYNELTNDAVEALVTARLATETPAFTVGRILERLATFHKMRAPLFHHLLPHAEELFRDIVGVVPGHVVVLQNTGVLESARTARKAWERNLNEPASISQYASLLANTIAAAAGEGNTTGHIISRAATKPYFHPRTACDVLTLSHAMRGLSRNADLTATMKRVVGAASPTVKYVVVLCSGSENCHGITHQLTRYKQLQKSAKFVVVTFTDDAEPSLLSKAARAAGFDTIELSSPNSRPDPDIIDKVLGTLYHCGDQAHFARAALGSLVPCGDLRVIRDAGYGAVGGSYLLEVLKKSGEVLAATGAMEGHSKWTRPPGEEVVADFTEVVAECVASGLVEADVREFKEKAVAGDWKGVEAEVGLWTRSLVAPTTPVVAAEGLLKVNRDVLEHVMSFCAKKWLLVAADTCRLWRYVTLSVLYTRDGTQEGKYKKEMKQLLLFGFIKKHGYPTCLQALRKRSGDTEAAIDDLTLGNV